MCDYKILEIVIQALVALGTLGAVIVALILSRSANKLKLKISFSIKSIYGMPGIDSNQEFAVLHVSNRGNRPAILHYTEFWMSFGKKDKVLLCHPLDVKWGKVYPIKLNFGESDSVCLSKYDEFITSITKDDCIYKNIHKIKFIYWSATGEKIYADIDKATRDRLIQDVQKKSLKK